MKNTIFLKPEHSPLMNAVDYFNLYADFSEIFKGKNDIHIKTDTEACCSSNDTTFKLNKTNNLIECLEDNKYDVAKGSKITKFMLLTAVKFKNDFSAAYNYVQYTLQKREIPYVRIATDYFKEVSLKDRFGGDYKQLIKWDKSTIIDDHTKNILPFIMKFNSFVMFPDNLNYKPVINNCYNLYSRFTHEAINDNIELSDIPTSATIMEHIFGDQVELGYKYMKILYEFPKQILPILVLTSAERETGKTTFLNWLKMIFSENSVLIQPENLTSTFNDSYAKKNIIMIDETVIEKKGAVEKLKSIATAKHILVNPKNVTPFEIPFFAKIIFCTNSEKTFMRIDEEEIRFWVRKIKAVKGQRNTKIEEDLHKEIPKFLKYLKDLPDIDFSRSRMVFTQDEITTDNLQAVKDESKSGLRKELEFLIESYFNENEDVKQFEATIKDLKLSWFANNNQISNHYIKTVLNDEMKILPGKNRKYTHMFTRDTQTGVAYTFINDNYKEVEFKEDGLPF